MRSLRLCVALALTVQVACGGSSPAPSVPSSKWAAPAILANVPADTPYLFASLEPVNDQIRARMTSGLDARMAEARKVFEGLRGTSPAIDPWIQAGLALFKELGSTPAANWWQTLGIAESGRFVLYGNSHWPTVRVELADAKRLRGVIERVIAAAGVKLQQSTHAGRAYWSTTHGPLTVIAAVLDQEAVIGLIPSGALESTLPHLLGLKPPAQSIAATTKLPDLLGRHRLLGHMLAFLDARALVDILTSTSTNPLDAPLHAATGPISPACRADAERLASIAPRFVVGYRRIDLEGFEAAGVVELPPSVTAALAKLRASVPGVTDRPAGKPMFAMGAAIRPDDLIGWLKSVAGKLREQPMRCPELAGLNKAGEELVAKLAQPLPPMARGIQGFSLVIDEASIMPPAVDGHLMIAGDLVADFLSTMSASLPAIAGIPVSRDGRPVELPLKQMGIPLSSAHIAMTPNRLVVTSGNGSAQRATSQLAVPAPKVSPLFTFSFDMPRFQKLMASFGQQNMAGFASLGVAGISLDVADEGLLMGIWGTWAEPAAQLAK